LQDELSFEIIDKLKIELLGKVKERVVKRYTDNDEAYDLSVFLKFHFELDWSGAKADLKRPLEGRRSRTCRS